MKTEVAIVAPSQKKLSRLWDVPSPEKDPFSSYQHQGREVAVFNTAGSDLGLGSDSKDK